MALVNDLMVYLNSQFSLRLPTLPLTGFPQFMVNLWYRITVNWSQGDQVPAVVQVDLTNPLVIPLGGGSVQAVAASILVNTGAAFPDEPAGRRRRPSPPGALVVRPTTACRRPRLCQRLLC